MIGSLCSLQNCVRCSTITLSKSVGVFILIVNVCLSSLVEIREQILKKLPGKGRKKLKMSYRQSWSSEEVQTFMNMILINNEY